MALTGPHPSINRDNDRDGLIDHRNLHAGPLCGLQQCSAFIAKVLGVLLNFFCDTFAQAAFVFEKVRQPALLVAQLRKLFLNLDCLKPGQLPQTNFKDVLGLNLSESEFFYQCWLGLIAFSNDSNDLINIQ